MANPEHVEVVGRGTDAIEAWRREHPDEWLDLGAADLSEADLGGSNLSGANLTHADLTDANLSSADLFGANPTYAYLTYAYLPLANLTAANLTSATLERTAFAETIFANTNLAGAKGLETVQHLGPSAIDHRTIEQSGDLPPAFLRGCGLPDDLIDFYTARYGQAIQFYSCFISYARKDEAFVDRLYVDLQENDVRCWRDTEDMKIGDRTRPVINQAIRVHDKVVLVLSEHSIASDWVETEVETAFRKERDEDRTVLFPVRLDDAIENTDEAWARQVWYTRNVGDFREWKDHDTYQEAFKRVLRDLRPEDS